MLLVSILPFFFLHLFFLHLLKLSDGAATIPLKQEIVGFNETLPVPQSNASVTIPKRPVKMSKGFTAGNNPKQVAIQRFKALVSDFFTDAQLSKSIDVAAVGMHKGKTLEVILDDIYARLRRSLTTKQISELSKAQKGLIADLDEKSAKLVKARIKRMIIYSFDPAAEQIHKFATKPSMAFALIAETLNDRFVSSVRGLIRDVLTAKEYSVFRKYYHPYIFKLGDGEMEKGVERSKGLVETVKPLTTRPALF